MTEQELTKSIKQLSQDVVKLEKKIIIRRILDLRETLANLNQED